MKITIANNKQRLHFEASLGDDTAFIEYRWDKDILVLMHTEVPKAHEGKGIAASLAKFVLEYARAHQLKIKVYCPYIIVYMKKHPEYNDLLYSPG